MKDLKTGDIILCSYTKTSGCAGYFARAIKFFTNSRYTHVGMILKDPSFLHPTLKGLYVWESCLGETADPQDGKVKFGVQISPLGEVLDYYKGKGEITIRRINCSPDLFSDTNLTKVHNVVHDKPYDVVPADWFEALVKVDPSPQKTNRFWCSALVGYIYTKCGLLDKETDWSILSPADFSTRADNLHFIEKNSLAKTEEKLI
jgi:hypothetical protein